MVIVRDISLLAAYVFVFSLCLLSGLYTLPGILILQANPDYGPLWLSAIGTFALSSYCLIKLASRSVSWRDIGWAIYLPIFFIVVLGVGVANIALLAHLMPRQSITAVGVVFIEVVVGFYILKRLVDYHMAND